MIEREFGNLLQIKDNYPKIVVTMDEKFSNTYQGIEHVPIRKFLMI
jgi:predicted AAA+ superfamily ATPase